MSRKISDNNERYYEQSQTGGDGLSRGDDIPGVISSTGPEIHAYKSG
jgi:hypothetical protein